MTSAFFLLATSSGVLIMGTQFFPMSSPQKNETSFEQAMERLEEIVSAMESDRMPLDEMVSSYEEGMKLLQVCRQRIDNARQRIETISLNPEGKAEISTFDASKSAEAGEEKPKSPARRRPTKTDAEDDSDDIRLF
jgi:exodeoxyribonuclease VII small subunit